MQNSNTITVNLFGYCTSQVVRKNDTTLFEIMLVIEYLSYLNSAITGGSFAFERGDFLNSDFLLVNDFCELMRKYFCFDYIMNAELDIYKKSGNPLLIYDGITPPLIQKKWRTIKSGNFMLHWGRHQNNHQFLHRNLLPQNERAARSYWDEINLKIGNQEIYDEIKLLKSDEQLCERNKEIINFRLSMLS